MCVRVRACVHSQQQCDGRTCEPLVHGVCRMYVSRAATALTPASCAACRRLCDVHALRPVTPTPSVSPLPPVETKTQCATHTHRKSRMHLNTATSAGP
jgi:hypothetical protein